MGKLVFGVLFFLFVLGLGLLVGPRVKVREEKIRKASLLPDNLRELQEWVIAREKPFLAQLREPGLAKNIVFANTSVPQKTAFSVVYLHGFSSSWKDVASVTELVAERLGANVFFSRLAGHGLLDGNKMGEVSAEDWLSDAVEAFEIGKKLGEKVIVMGLSTGATLGYWLAKYYRDDNALAGVVFLSPNFKLFSLAARQLNRGFVPALLSVTQAKRTLVLDTPLQKQIWTQRYPLTAVSHLLGLMDYCVGYAKPLKSLPVLFLYTPNDQTVSVKEAQAAFQQWDSPAKEWVEVPRAKTHVLTGAAISPQTVPFVENAISAFLTKNCLKL